MRKTLFRGKDKDNIWHYGDLIHLPNGMAIVECKQFTVKSAIEVLPETVGQLIKLFDKNKKKKINAYEGDIIKIRNGNSAQVWIQHYIVSYDDLSTLSFLKNYLQCENRAIEMIEDFEIIGNVTDNPELSSKSLK